MLVGNHSIQNNVVDSTEATRVINRLMVLSFIHASVLVVLSLALLLLVYFLVVVKVPEPLQFIRSCEK